MDRELALRLLGSERASERLRAVRYLARDLTEDDRLLLRKARSREVEHWVRTALERALEETGEAERRDQGEADDRSAQGLDARAVEVTTKRLLHEIRPIVGALRVCARREVDEYDNSRVAEQIERLGDLLSAIQTLSASASVPEIEQLDLSELVKYVVREEGRADVRVELAGSRPLVVYGDPLLLEIAIRNGVRNAIEACAELETPEHRLVVVSWGQTERDVWVAVLDRGPGLPANINRVWDIGISNKEGHHGMGLASARCAIESLGGEVQLRADSERGAIFELRWPRRQVPR